MAVCCRGLYRWAVRIVRSPFARLFPAVEVQANGLYRNILANGARYDFQLFISARASIIQLGYGRKGTEQTAYQFTATGTGRLLERRLF